MPDDAAPVAAEPEPIDLESPEVVARVNAEAHRLVHDLINPHLAALENTLQAPVLLTAAVAGVMSVAARASSPGAAIMGTLGLLVRHAQALGWLPPVADDQQVVLVLPPAAPDPLDFADMGRPN